MDIIGDWVADRKVGSLGLHDDWAAIDPPSLGQIKLSGPENDDIEALGSGICNFIWRTYGIMLFLHCSGYLWLCRI